MTIMGAEASGRRGRLLLQPQGLEQLLAVCSEAVIANSESRRQFDGFMFYHCVWCSQSCTSAMSLSSKRGGVCTLTPQCEFRVGGSDGIHRFRGAIARVYGAYIAGIDVLCYHWVTLFVLE